MYDSVSTITFISQAFPELKAEFHDELIDGLLHCQVAVFSRLAQSAIDNGDKDTWASIGQIFLTLWRDCTPEVTNALNVSFLEHLNFTDGRKNRSWAYKAMPMTMLHAWDAMEDYNRKLHGG